MLWRSTGDDMLRKYDFTYDAVNRLTGADFNQLNSNSFIKAAKIDFSVSGLTYDANGNILTMNQKGWKLGGSVTIDSLLYTYNGNSNKLLNVLDRKNDTATKLGDFRSSTAYMNALSNNKTTSATDYNYDGNGNMYIDKNKDISLIHYNYLNLPDSIVVTNKGNIKYVYDATGNKLKKITTEGSKVTTSLYLFGNFVNDTLQFLPTEEGRVRFNIANSSLQYDYFIKDHLGNVRMVLTEQKDTAFYPAVTFEDANTTNEQIYYENGGDQRTTRPGSFYTSGSNGDKVQLLRKSTQSVGAGKLLKVMAGDRLHIKVDYYIANDATDNSSANGQSAILTALSSLINNSPVTTNFHGGGSTVTNNLNSSPPFTSFISPENGSGGTMPKAYLNILFFDEQFNFVSTNSEIVQVTTKGSGQTITRISGSAKEAAKNGYAYVFVSNESNNLVYFDNLQITHERGPLTQDNSYSPWGLQLQGISSTSLNFGSPNNHYKYSGKEEQRQEFSDGSGLEQYDFGARNYDPQIGLWRQIDPMLIIMPRWSPYNYNFNNPMKFTDPTGMAPTYNWDTGEYEDIDKKGRKKVVSWEYVQQYYGIGSNDEGNNEKDNATQSPGDDPILKAVGQWTGSVTLNLDGKSSKTYAFKGVFKYTAWNNSLVAALDMGDLAYYFNYDIENENLQTIYFGDAATAPPTGFDEKFGGTSANPFGAVEKAFQKKLQGFGSVWVDIWEKLKETRQARFGIVDKLDLKGISEFKRGEYLTSHYFTWLYRLTIYKGPTSFNLNLGMANISVQTLVVNLYEGYEKTIKAQR